MNYYFIFNVWDSSSSSFESFNYCILGHDRLTHIEGCDGFHHVLLVLVVTTPLISTCYGVYTCSLQHPFCMYPILNISMIPHIFFQFQLLLIVSYIFSIVYSLNTNYDLPISVKHSVTPSPSFSVF